MRWNKEFIAGESAAGVIEALDDRLPPEDAQRLDNGPRPLLTLGELARVWCNRRVPPWLETEDPTDRPM